MISNKHRFHGPGGLKYVYNRGQAVRGPLFSLKCLQNPKRSNYRLAVVVSRKVNKSAVTRNRIRRRLYEIFRTLEIQGAWDIVVTVFHDTVTEVPTKLLQKQVSKQLKTAGITIAPKTTTKARSSVI